MKLKNDHLEDHLKHTSKLKKYLKHRSDGFPFDHESHCYYERYHALSQKLHAEFHRHVAAGNQSVDGGLLTDHGSDHINTVIHRASKLLKNSVDGLELTPYEIYLLLAGIHFHDLANIIGRDKHEKRISEMMDHVSSHLGDRIEKDCIRRIATVHGGKINGDKDTISYLHPKEPLNGCIVRPQMLAAILRLADELADDQHRASRILLALGVVPLGSEVYHKYAEALKSVMIRAEENSVDLHFWADCDDFTKTFGKIDSKTRNINQVYLLDEIFDRTLKTYLECIYCNRYMRPMVDIHSINVRIQASKKDEQIGDEIPDISYRLKEVGYPLEPQLGIWGLDESLAKWGENEEKLTGSLFANFISQLSE